MKHCTKDDTLNPLQKYYSETVVCGVVCISDFLVSGLHVLIFKPSQEQIKVQ